MYAVTCTFETCDYTEEAIVTTGTLKECAEMMSLFADGTRQEGCSVQRIPGQAKVICTHEGFSLTYECVHAA